MKLKLFLILFITIILIISLVSLILPVAIVENTVSQDKTNVYEPGAFLNYTMRGGSPFSYRSYNMYLWPKYLMLETLNNGAFVIHVSFRVFNTNYPSNAYDNNYSYNLPQQDNALFPSLFMESFEPFLLPLNFLLAFTLPTSRNKKEPEITHITISTGIY